jgi:hypothetical protein
MDAGSIPIKTAHGLDELARRTLRLSQRHRTVLLLVDGRRTLEQVQSLAQRAGAPGSCFGELLELGLVHLPLPLAQAQGEPEFVAMGAMATGEGRHLRVELPPPPASEPADAAGRRGARMRSSLPPLSPHGPDSGLGALEGLEGAASSVYAQRFSASGFDGLQAGASAADRAHEDQGP